MRQGKVWGNTELIFSGNNVEVHRIEGVLGGYCSRHVHAHKFNQFFVESGQIRVEQWQDDGACDVTELCAGDSCSVPPGVPHRFTVSQPCVAYEIYWVALDSEDIVRETTGGIALHNEGEPK